MDLGDVSADEIMRRWPHTMRLFVDRQVLCVGCPIAPFHTLSDVATEHGLGYEDLLQAVRRIAESEVTGGPAAGHRR